MLHRHRAALLAATLIVVPAGAAPAWAQTEGQPTAAPATPDPAASAPQASPPTPGQVAAPDQGQLADIVVTAQKRTENVQNVPIAVTSVGEQQLKVAGISSTVSLKELTPGLEFNTNLGGFGQPRIRGIGTTATGPGIENPVATYVDGVYIGSSTGAIFQLADVQQVDVLKGPQGTLFGRNATGGVIQVTTKTPTQDLTADAQASYGNYNSYGGSLYVSGGLAPGLAVSVAGIYNKQVDGYGRNLATNKDVQDGFDYGLRSKLRWRIGDATTVTLSGDYAKMNRADPALRTYQGLTILGTPTPGGNRDIDVDTQPIVRTQSGGATLNVTHDFSAVQLVSITAWRTAKLYTGIDADQTPQNLLNTYITQKDQQFSQEVQLISTASGPFKWVLGAYYLWSDGKFDPIVVQGILSCGYACKNDVVTQTVDQKLNSYAAFAQGTYTFGAATNLTLGVRYTSDHRQISETLNTTTTPFFGADSVVDVVEPKTERTFPKVTFRASLDHRFSPDLLAYASFNRGFKSGSFQPNTYPAQVLRPETVDAYEAGLKLDLFDRKVRFNVSAFYYNYTNLQANQIIQGVLNVYNAPGSINYGVDADMQWKVTRALTLNGGVAGLHARYKNGFDTPFFSVPIPNAASEANPFFKAVGGNSVIQCVSGTNYAGTVFAPCDSSGKRLQNTPDLTFNVGFDYRVDLASGRINLDGNLYHDGGYYGDPQNRLRQPAYTLVNASITFTADRDRYFVRAWVKNLTNAFYTEQLNALDVGDNSVAAPPRTYGGTVGFHF